MDFDFTYASIVNGSTFSYGGYIARRCDIGPRPTNSDWDLPDVPVICCFLVHMTPARDLRRLVGMKLAKRVWSTVPYEHIRVQEGVASGERKQRSDSGSILSRDSPNSWPSLDQKISPAIPSSMRSPKIVQHIGGETADCLPVYEWLGSSGRYL